MQQTLNPQHIKQHVTSVIDLKTIRSNTFADLKFGSLPVPACQGPALWIDGSHWSHAARCSSGGWACPLPFAANHVDSLSWSQRRWSGADALGCRGVGSYPDPVQGGALWGWSGPSLEESFAPSPPHSHCRSSGRGGGGISRRFASSCDCHHRGQTVFEI